MNVKKKRHLCVECVFILTAWLSCWGRSPGATPDGAPCCCTPLSCRPTSQRFSSVHHMICNQMIQPPSRRRRRLSAAKSQATATHPPSFSHATKKPSQHGWTERFSLFFPQQIRGRYLGKLCYKNVTRKPDKNATFASILFGSSEPSSSISRKAFPFARRHSVRQRYPPLFAKRLIYNSLPIVACRALPPTPTNPQNVKCWVISLVA